MKSPLRSHGRRPPVVAAAMMALLLTWGCEGDTVVSPTTVGSPDESPLDSSIHVSGTGTATAMPDLVEAYIGVQTFAAPADAAVDNNSTLMPAVINALTVSGIAPDDIETTNFSVNLLSWSSGSRRVGEALRRRKGSAQSWAWRDRPPSAYFGPVSRRRIN